MYKKWSLKSIFIISALTLGIIIFNFIVDPFGYYRKPTLYPAFYGLDQRILNLALAKNHTFDSLILGTSMTEQFRVSYVNKLLSANFLKLSLSGGTIYEQSLMFKYAAKYQDIKNVIWGVDLYSLSGEKESFRNKNAFAFYLYDENIFNDIKYLLNIQTTSWFFKIIKKYYIQKDKFYFNLDNLFLHQNINYDKIDSTLVIKNHNLYKLNANFKMQNFTFDKLKENFDYNVLSIVKSNPNTNFYIYLPPYSILALEQMKEHKWLKNAFLAREYIFNELKKIKNVYFFDFQAEVDFITNLNNYMDATHYKPKKNKEILNFFKNKNITKDIMKNNAKIQKTLKEIDFENDYK